MAVGFDYPWYFRLRRSALALHSFGARKRCYVPWRRRGPKNGSSPKTFGRARALQARSLDAQRALLQRLGFYCLGPKVLPCCFMFQSLDLETSLPARARGVRDRADTVAFLRQLLYLRGAGCQRSSEAALETPACDSRWNFPMKSDWGGCRPACGEEWRLCSVAKRL